MLHSGEQSYNKTNLTSQELESRLRSRGNVLEIQKVLDAYEMAKSVHEFQVRNDGTPYFSHSTRVVRILLDELGIYDEDVLIAALLHDVLEDSDTITRGVLEYNFGSYVAYMVEVLTKDLRRAARNPDEVDIEHLQRLKSSSDDCMIIKLAARLDNMRCLSFNLKRNPFIYLSNTLDRYLPVVEHSKNPLLQKLLTEIRMEANKFLG